jgi:hypothetical protein
MGSKEIRGVTKMAEITPEPYRTPSTEPSKVILAQHAPPAIPFAMLDGKVVKPIIISLDGPEDE